MLFFELETEEIGISGKVEMDEELYDELDAEELREMLNRVVNSFVRMKGFKDKNPELYGIKIN
jgi:hypothetical protein